MLNVVYDPFLTRTTAISEKNSFTTPFLLCSYFLTHPITLLLQILGGRMHGPSPPQILGDRPPSPPRSPSLCAMHYNTFATVETSSKISTAVKKTYQLFGFCCCVVCAHKLKISKKLAKLLEESKVKKFKHSKCLLVRVICSKNSNMNIT